jgi:transposase InsO family protein
MYKIFNQDTIVLFVYGYTGCPILEIVYSQVYGYQNLLLLMFRLGFKETTRRIRENIQIYNQLRPHASCDYLTPEKAHLKEGVLKKRWKPKVKILFV